MMTFKNALRTMKKRGLRRIATLPIGSSVGQQQMEAMEVVALMGGNPWNVGSDDRHREQFASRWESDIFARAMGELFPRTPCNHNCRKPRIKKPTKKSSK